MALNLQIDQHKLADFCRRWGIVELALFGSVLRDDFREDSDVDVLVTFAPGIVYSIGQFMEMQAELETIFGREVDLGTRRSVETDRNYIRRKAILNSAQVIYADGNLKTA